MDIYKQAFDHYYQAFKFRNTDFECITECIEYWWTLSNIIESDERAKEDATFEAKRSDIPDLPTSKHCYEQVMKLLHDMSDTRFDETHTALVKCLFENKYDDDNFAQQLADAARESGELAWLQARYRDAIAVAKKDLQPVIAACLSLCLAQLYFFHGADEDKAARIWESVGTEAAT